MFGLNVMISEQENASVRATSPLQRGLTLTAGWIGVVLWSAFAVASVAVFAIGSTEAALDRQTMWFAAGLLDAVLAGALLWRSRVSLEMPVVIAVYVFANRWLLFYLFLSVVFWDYMAP